jgi:hypothetical protein
MCAQEQQTYLHANLVLQGHIRAIWVGLSKIFDTSPELFWGLSALQYSTSCFSSENEGKLASDLVLAGARSEGACSACLAGLFSSDPG